MARRPRSTRRHDEHLSRSKTSPPHQKTQPTPHTIVHHTHSHTCPPHLKRMRNTPFTSSSLSSSYSLTSPRAASPVLPLSLIYKYGHSHHTHTLRPLLSPLLHRWPWRTQAAPPACPSALTLREHRARPQPASSSSSSSSSSSCPLPPPPPPPPPPPLTWRPPTTGQKTSLGSNRRRSRTNG